MYNFPSFIIGISWITRKVAHTIKLEITWKQDANGMIHMRSEVPFKKNDIFFKLGEEFEEKRLDGETHMVMNSDALCYTSF